MSKAQSPQMQALIGTARPSVSPLITLNSETFEMSSLTNGNTIAVTTLTALNTTGASLIVIAAVSFEIGGAVAFSDSKGNTYTGLTSQTDGSGVTRCRLAYCVNPTVGSSHTFTISTVGTCYPSIFVKVFNAGGAFDQQNGSSGVSRITQTPGSVTPGFNNEVVITAVSLDNNSSALAVNSSFVNTLVSPGTASFAFSGGMAHKIQTTAAAVNPTWSWTTSQAVAATIATFKNA